MSDGLERFKKEIATLRRKSEAGRSKPHKFVLLLAVLDLADDGLLNENKIYFNGALADRFAKYFELARTGNDWSQIAPPFFHLKTSPFWCHKVKEGREENYAQIKTSGGGSKRITDNIEYSYLSDYAFAAIQDSRTRANLRDFIIALFSPGTADRMRTATANQTQRLGTAFHESFRLSRPALQQVLRVVSESGGAPLTFDSFLQNTTLGRNYIKAGRRYAFGAGLLDEREKLTAFGEAVVQRDSSLSEIATQWMLHYQLSAPHGNGPEFWHHLVRKYFSAGQNIDGESAKNEIAALESELADRTQRTTATIFLGTYSESDSLGALGILKESEKGRYLVREERAAVPLGAVACALGDFWAARFGEAKQVNLSDVTGPDGLAPLLLLSRGELNRLLGQLQARGLVTLQSVTPPYQIGREWADPAALWERLHEL